MSFSKGIRKYTVCWNLNYTTSDFKWSDIDNLHEMRRHKKAFPQMREGF